MSNERQSFALKYSFMERIQRANLSDAEFRDLILACCLYAYRGDATKFDDRLLKSLFSEFQEYEDFCWKRWCKYHIDG